MEDRATPEVADRHTPVAVTEAITCDKQMRYVLHALVLRAVPHTAEHLV